MECNWVRMRERVPDHDGSYVIASIVNNKPLMMTATWHSSGFEHYQKPCFVRYNDDLGFYAVRNVMYWLEGLNEP